MNVFQTPLPFYATQIINPFLNSRISANHDKVEGHSAKGEILIKEIDTILKPRLFLSLCRLILLSQAFGYNTYF